MRIVSMCTLTLVVYIAATTLGFAQVSLLWESSATLGDKGALYAAATETYPVNYVLDTLSLTGLFYNSDTYALLATMSSIGKYEYPYYILPDMNGNGSPEIVFANYNLPSYIVRIRDLSTGATLQSWGDASFSYALWYVLTTPGSAALKLAMLKTSLTAGTSSLVVYSLGVSAMAVGGDQSDAKPEHARLHQNYPNPFNPETRIRYDIPTAGSVTLEIFNLNGRLVRSFTSNQQEAGEHEVVWNGKDNANVSVASGSYLYRIVANGAASAKKMVLLR
jgi:hypothetical protein